MYTHNNHCHRTTAHLQLIIIIIIIIIIVYIYIYVCVCVCVCVCLAVLYEHRRNSTTGKLKSCILTSFVCVILNLLGNKHLSFGKLEGASG